jgi:hypothetical protein
MVTMVRFSLDTVLKGKRIFKGSDRSPLPLEFQFRAEQRRRGESNRFETSSYLRLILSLFMSLEGDNKTI